MFLKIYYLSIQFPTKSLDCDITRGVLGIRTDARCSWFRSYYIKYKKKHLAIVSQYQPVTWVHFANYFVRNIVLVNITFGTSIQFQPVPVKTSASQFRVRQCQQLKACVSQCQPVPASVSQWHLVSASASLWNSVSATDSLWQSVSAWLLHPYLSSLPPIFMWLLLVIKCALRAILRVPREPFIMTLGLLAMLGLNGPGAIQ